MPVGMLLLLPYVAIALGYAIVLRAAWRSERKTVLIPLVGSLVVTVAFAAWGYFDIRTSRSSTAAIGYLFLPFYAVFVALASWFILWAVVCLIRFALSIRRQSTADRPPIPLLLCALLILFATVAIAGTWLARQHVLHVAATSSNAAKQDSILAGALARHDLELLSALAKNPNASADDLVRIYDSCKEHLPEFNPAEYVVFHSLAQNSATPTDILAALMSARQTSIRTALAANPSLPHELLLKLSNDPDQVVRYWADVSLQHPRRKSDGH